MTHFAFANLKSTIQSSLGSLLAIVMATVSVLAIPSSAPPASAETAFSQLGADIDGVSANDNFGWSVALSSDGSRVVIGALYNDDDSTDAGLVRIYDLKEGSWQQVGSNIYGAAGSQSGRSVAISSDGSRVAIGAPNSAKGDVRIYDYDGVDGDEDGINKWSQVGDDIVGYRPQDRFGYSVALSSDGSRVAIGGVWNDGNGDRAGHVRIYDWNGSSWTQVGPDIDGEAAKNYFGWSVALSSDGSRVAIGAPASTIAGRVKIYDYDGVDDDWDQVGGDIDGEAASDESGISVALSSDGSRVAIGAVGNDGNGSNAGHARIYDYDGVDDDWDQVGDDIDGENAEDKSGYSVELSSDGSRVAIGAWLNDGNGSNAGHVRIYDYDGVDGDADGINKWSQVGDDIDGENAEDRFGSSVGLSNDGSRVAIGAIRNDDGGTNAGHVRVFSAVELEAALTPTFATPTQTSDGFTVQVSNYDDNYSWTASASSGSAAISGSGLITVTGLSAGASSTVTVGTTRSGYSAGSADVSSSAFTTLTPTFATPTKTSDGYTVQVSNYEASFTWSVSASSGSAAISGSGLITVTGLSAGASSTVTASNTRTGYTAGSATVSGTAAASESAGSSSSSAYDGPIPTSKASSAAGSEVTLKGLRLETVFSAFVGDVELAVVSATSDSLVLSIPESLETGTHDIVLNSSKGTVTYLQGLTVLELEPENIEATVDKKLTVGSFKGFIAIYTKGYEGSKLSAKVAGKWLVVDSLDESWRGNDYSRTVRFTGAGYDIFAHLYIDGEYIRTDELVTR